MSVVVAFDKARAEGRAALVGYLPAGFPTVEGGIAAVRALVDRRRRPDRGRLPVLRPGHGRSGDPAGQPASRWTSGVRAADVLRTVEAVARTGAPVVVMTYWNLVEHYGGGAGDRGMRPSSRRDLAGAGGSG